MLQRKPLPSSKLGEKETRTLYNRYHGLKNKAQEKKVPFEWDSFEKFLKDVLSVAPEGYLPSKYRMRFDFKKGGYKKATMKIFQGKELKEEEHEQLMRLAGEAPVTPNCDIVAEVTMLLLTTDDTLASIMAQAMLNVNAERENV